MERIEPRAVCYHGAPDGIVGWACGECGTVYMLNKVGSDAETIAAYCCNHGCWKCGRLTTRGKLVCGVCRVGNGTDATRVESVFHMPERETTTLTAPEGHIGAIGSPAEDADEDDGTGGLSS